MEIAVFLVMMIVPFISVAALIVAVINNRKVSALKSLTLQLIRSKGKSEKNDDLVNEFKIMEL